MTKSENDLWIENCKENFDEALIENDFAMAGACVEDARAAGFTGDAITMLAELKVAQKTLQDDMDSL